jgi:hypothetical protein
VANWQIVLFAFFVLLPFALLYDFWPDRDRLDAQGRPLPRDWDPQIVHPPRADEHH